MERYDALLLWAMREKNQVRTFYEKMESLRQVHKNRQITVDFMSNIWLHVGMDARELKKQLLAEMLLQYQGIFSSQSDEDQRREAAFVMDIDYQEDGISEAAFARYIRVMDKLVDDAMAKAGH